MYIRDLESWLKWIAISLSVVVAFVVFEGVEGAAGAAGTSGMAEDGAAGAATAGVRSSGRLGDRWERHVTTLAVLMAYTELLLLLCRFPRWGLRVLMFYKVAINVIKVRMPAENLKAFIEWS